MAQVPFPNEVALGALGRETPTFSKTDVRAGCRRPQTGEAGGSVLLAYAPHEVLDAILEKPLERFTDGTITDAGALKRALRRIREDGAHVALSDLEEDTFSIAAPIFDDRSQAVASFSIAGPLMRLDHTKQERYLQLIREASRELSEGLGFLAGSRVLSRLAAP